MKRNIFLLSNLLIVFTFLLSITPFNFISAYRLTAYSRAYDTKGHLSTAIDISETNTLLNVDPTSFFKTFEELANKNNLVIYALKTDNSSTETYNFYISSNDLYLNDWILLDSSTHVDFIKHNYYSTKAPRSNRISNILPSFSVSISDITCCPEIQGRYIFFNLKGDISENINQLMIDLQQKYGDISYTGDTPVYDFKSDLYYSGGLTNDIVFKISIILILTLLLCSKIFSMVKNISIHKIEGQSAISIYYDLFLKYFLKYSLCCLVIFIILLSIHFFGGWNSFRVFIDLFFLEFIQVFIIELFISSILYFVIKFVPIVRSIKGENKMFVVEQIAYLTKMIAVFILLPSILTSFMQANRLIKMISRHKHVSNLLENYYELNGDLTSRYSLDIGQPQYIAVKKQFIQDTNSFRFAKSYWSSELQTPDANNLKWFYSISWSYLISNGYIENNEWEKDIVVLLPENQPYKQGEIEWNVISSIPDKKEVHFIEINSIPRTFSLSELLIQDNISPYPLVYIPDLYGYEGQINNSIFYNEDGLEKATALANKSFIDNGYVPAYEVKSMKTSFEGYYQSNVDSLVKHVILFISILFAIVLTNRFLIQSDIDCNKQRYFVSYTEGVQPYHITFYILKICSPSILALIACILSNRITSLENILLNILFIILLETILYFYYLYYYRKVVHK